MTESQIRLPTREPIPRWYELGVVNVRTLEIRVHNQAMDFLQSCNLANIPLVQGLRQRFSLREFIPLPNSSWGFGQMMLWGPEAALELVKVKGEWTILRCRLPAFARGEDGDSRDSHRKFFQLRATLMVLFNALEVFGFDHDTGYSLPQLLVVCGFSLGYGPADGSLSATLTPEMMKYLSVHADNQEVSKTLCRAMKSATDHMFPDLRSCTRLGHYRAEIRSPKWLYLQVPGDACDLGPDSVYEFQRADGYRLVSHNVDSSPQQLGLLMGLAKLHDLANKFLCPQA